MEIQKKVTEEAQSRTKRSAVVRYGSIAAAFVLVAGSVLGIALSGGNRNAASPQAPLAAAESAQAADQAAGNAESVSIQNYSDLYNLILGMRDYYGEGSANYARDDAVAGAPEMAAAEEAPMATDGGSTLKGEATTATGAGPEYSGTNVQVMGVDEADVVKTDGSYIYYLSGGNLVIAKADGEKTRVESATEYFNQENWWGYSSEMFILGDRLMILTRGWNTVWVGTAKEGYQMDQDKTVSVVYDISNRNKPVLVTTLGQSGSYVSSRMIGDYVYVVTSQQVYSALRDTPSTYIPELVVNGTAKPMPIDSIYPYPDPKTPVYTVVSAFNLKNGTEHASSRATLGGAGSVYCNLNHLLIAASDYTEDVSPIAPDKDGKNVQVTKSTTNTRLMLFALDAGKIEKLASATVPGMLLNQFSMDEYNGAFRVVTTVNEWTQRIFTDGVDTYEYDDDTYNCLYTLSGNLEMLGKLERIAKDESVQSVRFDGDIGYFVTFRQVDPLFAVDLSNPEKPYILDALKIPGFSDYLHVFSEGRLLGIGYAADEKTGATQGVKLSMFDTTNKKNITELFTQRVDADWSMAGQNHKSILVSPEKNLIAFPADQKYFIFSYSDANGFTNKATVGLEDDLWSWNMRGLFIGDYFYVCSESSIVVLSLADFTRVEKISIG